MYWTIIIVGVIYLAYYLLTKDLKKEIESKTKNENDDITESK